MKEIVHENPLVKESQEPAQTQTTPEEDQFICCCSCCCVLWIAALFQ